MLTRYRTLRSYIEHEDKLADDRLSRTLTLHGFLLASYGLLVQARISSAKCLGKTGECAEAGLKYMQEILQLTGVMLPIIAAIGLLTTLAAKLGIDCAEASINEIKRKYEPGFHDKLGLPPFTGGGAKINMTKSDLSMRIVVWTLLGLWLVVVFFSLRGVV